VVGTARRAARVVEHEARVALARHVRLLARESVDAAHAAGSDAQCVREGATRAVGAHLRFNVRKGAGRARRARGLSAGLHWREAIIALARRAQHRALGREGVVVARNARRGVAPRLVAVSWAGSARGRARRRLAVQRTLLAGVLADVILVVVEGADHAGIRWLRASVVEPQVAHAARHLGARRQRLRVAPVGCAARAARLVLVRVHGTGGTRRGVRCRVGGVTRVAFAARARLRIGPCVGRARLARLGPRGVGEAVVEAVLARRVLELALHTRDTALAFRGPGPPHPAVAHAVLDAVAPALLG